MHPNNGLLLLIPEKWMFPNYLRFIIRLRIMRLVSRILATLCQPRWFYFPVWLGQIGRITAVIHPCGISSDHLGDELNLEWTFEAGKFLKSSPVVSAGKIFLGGPTGIFHALEFKTGQEIWKAEAGIGVDAPALIIDNNVLVGTKDGWLLCLELSTGKKKWSYETMGEIVGAPNHSFLPESNRSVILVGSYDNFVHCVDAITGALVWKFETLNYINGTPAVWNNNAVLMGG